MVSLICVKKHGQCPGINECSVLTITIITTSTTTGKVQFTFGYFRVRIGQQYLTYSGEPKLVYRDVGLKFIQNKSNRPSISKLVCTKSYQPDTTVCGEVENFHQAAQPRISFFLLGSFFCVSLSHLTVTKRSFAFNLALLFSCKYASINFNNHQG